MKTKNLFFLCIILFLICFDIFAGTWHSDITHRPRLIYLNSEVSAIRSLIGTGIYNKLWNNNYKDRNNNFVRGIYWNAYQEPNAIPNTIANPRTIAEPRAQIAKNAAFVYAMNKRADGITDLNSFTGPNDPHPRDWYKDHAIDYLEGIDPTVIGPSWPNNYNLIDYVFNWQWRAKEIIHYCQAYDILLGAGVPANSTIENKIKQFAINLYSSFTYHTAIYQFLLRRTNHRVMTVTALGMVAVTLNNSSYAGTWISTAMTEINRVLFDLEQSVDGINQIDNDGGYAEGPGYFRYIMKHLLPFFLAMKNFNGDWTETYTWSWYYQTLSYDLRSPWYDPRYNKCYDWATKIKMPDGRLPAIEDTYQDAYFPELAILGGHYSWPYKSFDSNLSDEAILNLNLSQLVDMRIEYIAAGNVNTQSPSWTNMQVMPDAGSAVFRSGWGTEDIYLHLDGQHGTSRWNGFSHDHADVTSFILNHKGDVLLIDGGYINYDNHYTVNKPHIHNLVQINGVGPIPPSGPIFYSTALGVTYTHRASLVNGYLQNAHNSENFNYAEVEANYGKLYELVAVSNNQEAWEYNSGSTTSVDVTRGIIFVDNRYFVVSDELDNQDSDGKFYQFVLHGNGGGTSGGTFQSIPSGGIWTHGNSKVKCFVTEINGGLFNAQSQYNHGDGHGNIKTHEAIRLWDYCVDAKFLSVLYPYDSNITTDPEITEFYDSNYTGLFVNRVNTTFGGRYEIIISQDGDQIYIPEMLFGTNTIKSIETDADLLVLSFDSDFPNDPEYINIFAKNSKYIKYGADLFFLPNNTNAICTDFINKYHLRSDNSEATASNNGRRIVRDGEGLLHVVYEDKKKIWYSMSEDNGDTWSDEELVSNYDPAAVYSFPAIALNGTKLHVVFTMSFNELPEMRELLYYTKDLNEGNWISPSSTFYSCNMNSQLKPSIALYYKENVETVMVAFETNITGEGSMVHCYHKVGNGSWGEKQFFPGKTPSLAVDNSYGPSSEYNEAFLVYEYAGKIYGRRWFCNQSAELWGYWDGDDWVNAGYDLIQGEVSIDASYHNPCATLSQLGTNTGCYVTWEVHSNIGQENTNNRIGFRTYCLEGHFLSEITEFSETNSSQPTISSWQEELGVTLFFESSDYIYKRVGTHVPGLFPPEFEWEGQYIGPGRAVNVMSSGHTGLYLFDAGATYTSSTAAPYLVKFDYWDGEVNPPPPVESSNTQRAVTSENVKTLIDLDSLAMYKRFDYCLPKDSSVSFSLSFNDIRIGKKHVKFNKKLFSPSLSLTQSNSNLKLDLSCLFYKTPVFTDSNKVLFDLQFKNKNGSVVSLKSLSLREILPLNNGMINSIPVTISMASPVNQKGKLFLSMDSTITNIINVVTYPDTVLENVSFKPGHKENALMIPKKYDLHPAYPNPFNPMATITFDIPYESTMKLVVYDVQGKVVTELISGRKKAGRYTAQFDGSNLSSGIYFYEMIAEPQTGKGKTFRKVNKMMLVK